MINWAVLSVVRCFFSALHLGLLASVALVTLACCAGPAQAADTNVGVLRSTASTTPAALAETIDAALLRDLAEIAGIANPIVSPIDLAEIQLNVGCADDGRACLESMARAAGTDALLVRSLSSAAEGGIRLELRYFDSASSDEPRAVSAHVPEQSSDQLVRSVPALVRELFGIPEVAAPAEPAAGEPASPAVRPAVEFAPRSDESSSLVPWILLGAGAAALAAGAIFGAIASDDFRSWKRRPIRTSIEAEQARGDFDDLETRALAADIAMIGGAVALGLGATLLVLEIGGPEPGDSDRAAIGIEPRSDGALLRVQSTFDEGP